ncbi:MAG: cation diffusion facilitator family transporter [Desulfosalsimonadaceae bacterium]
MAAKQHEHIKQAAGSAENGHRAHSPAESGMGARLLLTLAINFIIPVAQVAGGILSNSIALISDAVHNFSDFAAVFISYMAYRIGRRGVSARHSFGLQRAEILSALFNVIILCCAVAYIIYTALQRFFQPEPVSGWIVIALAGVGLAGNGLSAWLLHRDAEHNLNVRGAFLHMLGDFLTSAAVLVSGAVLVLKPWYWIDPLLSVFIGAFILKNSWSVLRESVNILMNAVPRGLDLEDVQEFLENRPEIHSAHYLHAWQTGSRGIDFTCHLTVDDQMVSETEGLAADLRQRLWNGFGIDHPVFQFESSVCGNATLTCEIADCGHAAKKGAERKNPAGRTYMDFLFFFLRLAAGGIFIYAALPKIINPQAFAETVANYQILPGLLVSPVTIVLPWLELFTGILIILGIWLEGALVIYNSLMLIFTAILVYNTARGLDIHCGCFSQSAGHIINSKTIIRDVLIWIPAALLLLRVFTKRAKKSARSGQS